MDGTDLMASVPYTKRWELSRHLGSQQRQRYKGQQERLRATPIHGGMCDFCLEHRSPSGLRLVRTCDISTLSTLTIPVFRHLYQAVVYPLISYFMLQPILLIGENKLAKVFSRSGGKALPSWLSIPIAFHVNLFIAQKLYMAPMVKQGAADHAFELRDTVLQAGGIDDMHM